MSGSQTFDKILGILDEFFNIVTGKNWRIYSVERTRILLSKKIYELKDLLSDIPIDFNINSKEITSYIERILSKLNEIMNYINQKELLFAWYELELFRLSFATLYANSWGQGGDLHVAGTANALANALMGIHTLDVENLYVDWSHHEFHKRRVIMLNYLGSAMSFFFTLTSSLDTIYKHDAEYWLEEALKACEQ
ncbi:MAG: hypothetical protein ACTSPI_11300, partial [Candidatus Heimdallarchaeaceae archaeon]